MFHIVLVEPEIPQNAGNIARTCAATGTHLHMVRPLGFEVTDKYLKRAGLDYWHLVDVRDYESLEEFWERNQPQDFFLLSTKAPRSYTEVSYPDGSWLFFGAETRGLPESLLYAHPDRCLRIPIRSEARSLNLANSVAIVTFEALRQQEFPHLAPAGKMANP